MIYMVTYGTNIYYDDKRLFPFSTRNKTDYLLKSISSDKIKLTVLSDTISEKKMCIIPKRKEKRYGHDIVNPPLICGFGKINKVIQKLCVNLWIFIYLMFHTKRHEEVLVYHFSSRFYPFRFANFFKKYNYILEVEELFYNLTSSSKTKKLEQAVIKQASKYIVASNCIMNQINLINNNKFKPHYLFFGNLDIENIKSINNDIDNNEINVVYSGLIQKGKVAFDAIDIFKLLPDNYILNICGYGTKDDIKLLEEEIKNHNYFYESKIIYHGMLQGDNYDNLLCRCKIGISPQNPSEIFANSCFPSKIMEYMKRNLIVVSSNSNSIKNSPIGDLIIFPKENSKESFAQAIKSCIEVKNYNSFNIIEKLDTLFRDNIINFLKM